MGQIVLVKTEVRRIVRHAGIGPEMSWRKLGKDLWQLLLTWWSAMSKRLLRVSIALGIS